MNKLQIIALLLLAIPLVNADILIAKYDHNAYVDSPFQTTRVCGCGVATDYFILENVGDLDANFLLSLETESPWITLQQKSIYLKSGEKTRIAVTLAPPCGTDVETSYKIYATSQFGRFRAVDRTVTSQECESVRVSLIKHQEEILPCQTAYYTLELENVATYQDTYWISASPEEIKLSEDTVTLKPGEKASINAQVEFACDVHGDIPLDFYVTSQKNNRFHQQSTTLSILEDYAYSASFVASEKSICAEEETTHAVQVTNIANTPNTYRLEVDSVFVTADDDYFKLLPGESKVIRLFVNPTESDVGDKTYTVTITEQSSGNSKQLTTDINIRDCYEHELFIYPPEITACEGTTEALVQLANRGENTEVYELNSYGDLFSQLEQNTIALRPNEQAEIPMIIGIPDRTEDFSIYVSAKQSPGEETVVEIPVHTVSNADCTELQPKTTKLEVYRGEVDIIPFIVEHQGIEAATYNLSITGNVFELVEDQVFLEPGESATLHLKAKNLADVPSGRYVEKFIMESHRAIYRDDIKVVLKDRSFLSSIWQALTRDDIGGINYCGLLLVILSIIAGLILLYTILVAAGVFEPIKIAESTSSVLSKLLFSIIIITVILAVISAGKVVVPVEYVEPLEGSNPSLLYHEWPQDEEYFIDLDDYFVDPDNEELTYSDNQPEHFTIEYDNSVAVIRPERGWYGQEQIVFTATDSKGLSTDSPIMTLKVIGKVPVSLLDYAKLYCKTINWLLVALTSLLLIILVSLADKKEDDEYDEYEESKDLTPITSLSEQAVSDVNKTTQVAGDVVAGDKVTIINAPKEHLYVASVNGRKFHPIDSPYAQRIPKEKRIVFKSKEEAIKAGYSPSKVYMKD